MAGVSCRHDTTAELYFAPSQFEAYLDYAFAGGSRREKSSARAFQRAVCFQTLMAAIELPDGGLGTK